MRCLNRHQLKELHPEIFDMTYKSWDDTKQRGQKEGVSLHPRLSAFSDFLEEVGPRIRREYTLDRIRPGELGGRYEPGNLRWMDKRGQANNRGSTRMLTYKGIEKPASIWAEEFNQKRNTVLSRIDRQGWSVEEALTGQRRGRTSFEKRPWDHNADALEREEAEQFYLGYKHTIETPLGFCSRKYAEGLWPWKSLLDGLGFYQGEGVDPTYGIAAHCLPTLLKAKDLVERFSPRGRWIKGVLAEMNKVSENAKKAESSKLARHVFRHGDQRRVRDREVEYHNFVENFPELIDDDVTPW